uniref:Uncharacterized protein n=1 Tax=Anguilla anguilla TaxID=7936 RepID=A0A0E9T162_ANGAN
MYLLFYGKRMNVQQHICNEIKTLHVPLTLLII